MFQKNNQIQSVKKPEENACQNYSNFELNYQTMCQDMKLCAQKLTQKEIINFTNSFKAGSINYQNSEIISKKTLDLFINNVELLPFAEKKFLKSCCERCSSIFTKHFEAEYQYIKDNKIDEVICKNLYDNIYEGGQNEKNKEDGEEAKENEENEENEEQTNSRNSNASISLAQNQIVENANFPNQSSLGDAVVQYHFGNQNEQIGNQNEYIGNQGEQLEDSYMSNYQLDDQQNNDVQYQISSSLINSKDQPQNLKNQEYPFDNTSLIINNNNGFRKKKLLFLEQKKQDQYQIAEEQNILQNQQHQPAQVLQNDGNQNIIAPQNNQNSNILAPQNNNKNLIQNHQAPQNNNNNENQIENNSAPQNNNNNENQIQINSVLRNNNENQINDFLQNLFQNVQLKLRQIECSCDALWRCFGFAFINSLVFEIKNRSLQLSNFFGQNIEKILIVCLICVLAVLAIIAQVNKTQILDNTQIIVRVEQMLAASVTGDELKKLCQLFKVFVSKRDKPSALNLYCNAVGPTLDNLYYAMQSICPDLLDLLWSLIHIKYCRISTI